MSKNRIITICVRKLLQIATLVTRCVSYYKIPWNDFFNQEKFIKIRAFIFYTRGFATHVLLVS